MALTRCPECAGEISTTAKKCPHCGFEGVGGPAPCPECGETVSALPEFCPGCGFPIRSASRRPAMKPCPYCDEEVAADAASCRHCGEAIANKVWSFCDRCRDEYVVDAGAGTFTCPGCGKSCDIEKGRRLLDALAVRKAKIGKRRRPTRPGS